MVNEYRQEARKRDLWVVALILAAAVTLLHGQTLFSPPLFDDKLQLSIQQIFTDYAAPFRIQARWLSYGTFAWTFQLLGENWVVFRAQNVVLHSMVVASLFLFFNRLIYVALVPTQPSARLPRHTLLAAAGALIYGLQPATVYAVSYLIQRSIIMATLFSVLSLWCLLEATLTKRTAWYVGSAMLYLLALSSKEHAIMLPAVGVAMVHLLNTADKKVAARWLWAAVGIVVIAVIALLRVYDEHIGAVFDATSRQLIAQLAQDFPFVAEHPYLLSVINETYLFFKYLLLWLIPYPNWMAVDMREPFPVALMAWPQLLGPPLLGVYLGIAIYLLIQRQEKGLLGFALLTPALLFPTELATVWIQDPFAIYRSYIWMFAIPAALPIITRYTPPKLILGGGLMLIALLMTATWNRLETFKSEMSLWGDVVRHNKTQVNSSALGRERGFNELAAAYAQAGEFEKALVEYTEAIKINPKDANLYSNRGAIYQLLNNLEPAQGDVNVALSIEPKNPRALYNQGAIYLKQGNPGQALEMFTRIIDANLDGTSKDAYGARAVLLLKSGKLPEALTDLNQAIKLDNNYVDGYMNRGTAQGMLGNNQEALADFTQVIKLNPKSIEARVNRAMILNSLTRAQDALRDANDAISLDPTNTKAHLLRAQLFVAQGRVQDALNECEITLKINPKEAMAYLNRAEILIFLKNIPAARSDLSESCQLGLQAACAKLANLGS